MQKKATVYQLSDMLPFQLVCSKYAANMLQNQILEEAHLLISICHAKKPLYTNFYALIIICSYQLLPYYTRGQNWPPETGSGASLPAVFSGKQEVPTSSDYTI